MWDVGWDGMGWDGMDRWIDGYIYMYTQRRIYYIPHMYTPAYESTHTRNIRRTHVFVAIDVIKYESVC